MLENILQLFKHFPEFSDSLAAGIIIFSRFLGFSILSAPILSRKEIPVLVKISLALMITVSFIGILSPKAPPPDSSLFLSIVLNVVFGALLGFIASIIFDIITSAGDMINMQMGLTSSTMFDPTTKQQTSVMGVFMGLLGSIIFVNIGGLYWLFSAFERSFTVFPIYGTSIPLEKVINMDYLVLLTGNVLLIGLQIAAPVLLATLAQDVILGIISRIAPQVNVFQLSFLFKPVIGVAIILVLLPTLINIITDYFLAYSKIY